MTGIRFFARGVRWPALLVLLVLGGCSAMGPRGQDETEIEHAVVKISVTSQHGDWYSPWQRARPTRATGSGFVVAPGRVLTNAHIVSDAKQIILHRHGDPTPYLAAVEYVAHDSDLALLTVAAPDFWRGVRALPVGDLPSLRTHVRTFGYPAGGEKISRTEGVVSRIEFKTYWHSGADAHLAIQTDSAINPGNSGGPVLQDGKVVGVAFQTNVQLNDVGYFIPTTVVKRFLRDIADGAYQGYPEMGIVTGNLINPAYRDYVGLPPGVTGVVVDRLVPGASAEGFLQPGDVLTAVNGMVIEPDGTIDYHGHSLNFEQVAEEKQVGEQVSFSVWRERKATHVSFPLKPFQDGQRVRSRFDTLPGYVVYAGLVFMVLEREYLNIFGNFRKNGKKSLLYDHFYRRTEHPEMQGTETVVLSRILPHPVNSVYRARSNSIVSEINGIPIHRLADVPKAFASAKGRFHTLELARSDVEVLLDRKAADAAHAEILATYGIPSDRRLP